MLFPPKLLHLIGSKITSSNTWFAFVCAIPALGRYSCDAQVQRELKERFICHEFSMHDKGRDVIMILKESRLPNGQLHSVNDQPAVRLYRRSSDGKVHYERWYTDGELDRGDDQPAVCIWSYDQRLIYREWFQSGKSSSKVTAPLYMDDINMFYVHMRMRRVPICMSISEWLSIPEQQENNEMLLDEVD